MYLYFLLFTSSEHLIKFRRFLNKCQPNMKFSFEEEKHGKLSFADAQVAEKKTLTSFFSFSWRIVHSNHGKLQKVLKKTLGCCKIQLVFKNQRNLPNVFRFKNRLLTTLCLVLFKFQSGRCNASYYGETDTHLKIRPGEHISISSISF